MAMDGETNYENRLATQDETTAMLGPILVGQIVAIFLFGVLVSNFSHFISTSSWTQSRRLLRAAVLLVVALTTTVTGLYAVDIWDFGTYAPATDVAYLEQGAVHSAIQPVFLLVIAVIVQVTLVTRSSRIIEEARWRTMYFVAAAMLIVVEAFAAACACAYEIRFAIIPDEDFEIGYFDWTTSVIVWHWAAAVIDMLISAIYVVNLSRRLGGVAHTVGAESVVRLIVLLVVRSAAYTAVLAIASASVMTAFPGWNLMTEDIYYALWIPLPVLYALSLFTTLSIRERVTAELEHQNESRRRSLSGSGAVPTSSSKRRRCNQNKRKSNLNGTKSSGGGGWNLSLCGGGHMVSTTSLSSHAVQFQGVRVEREVVVSKSEVDNESRDLSAASSARPRSQIIQLQDHALHDNEEKAPGGKEGVSRRLRPESEHTASWSASWHDPENFVDEGDDPEDEHQLATRRRKRLRGI